MNIRRSIIWFVTIVAVLIALVLWFGNNQPVETPLAVTTATDTVLPAATTPSVPVSAPIHTNTPVTQVVPHGPIPTPPLETKEQQMREGLAGLNDENVVLYGKVIDQFNVPVAGATVSGVIQVNNGARVGTDRLSLTTDASGTFTVSGYKGENLGITIKKAGYALATANTSFVYSLLWPEPQRHIPDPNNPVVFKMWRLQGAEPLVGINKIFKLPYTSAPIYFDLIAGQTVPSGGDLEAVIKRASGSLSKKSPGDWSIDLKPVNGGIKESDYQAAQFMFEAPVEGYQHDYFLQMNGNDPAWHDGIDKEFLLKSRDGQVYSKFYLVFGINREPNDSVYFQFKGAANANSSRNWEATAPQ